MRRITTTGIVLAFLLSAGCAMFQKPPPDDPATAVDETAEHAAKVVEEEDTLRTAAAIITPLTPPPFQWVPGLITTAILGIGTWMRARSNGK